MTKRADFKRRVRARMARTGESYATARVRLLAEQTGGAAGRLEAVGVQAPRLRERSPVKARPDLTHVPLILGESDGRVRVPLGGCPAGTIAVSVPVRRGGTARIPRDRHRDLKIVDVDLIAAHATAAFAPPSEVSSEDLVFVLSADRREWTTVERHFGTDRAWSAAISLARCGGVVVRCATDESLFLTRPIAWRLSRAWSEQRIDLLRELRGSRDPDVLRAELMQLMAEVPELRAEHDLLAALPTGAPLRVPSASGTGTRAWSVYECAIRAAAAWWAHRAMSVEQLTAKGLAALAFRNSKGWTSERQAAFVNLVGVAFDKAVSQAETDIRVRGPLVWTLGRVAADAEVAHPWISLPAKSIHIAGVVRCDAEGILLVENSDTFEQVCKIPDVVGRWLCVWGKGQTSGGIVALLSTLAALPVAAWCDLDADGISIIKVFSRKIGRVVHPVGMDVELWRSGPKRVQTAEQVDRDKAIAGRLAVDGPEPLRPLASQIAIAGGSCEQESLHEVVLPSLARVLDGVRNRETAG